MNNAYVYKNTDFEWKTVEMYLKFENPQVDNWKYKKSGNKIWKSIVDKCIKVTKEIFFIFFCDNVIRLLNS